jgi:adenine phosphoribosyltransferase
MADLASELRRAIRDVPDFPKPGIVFKDITPVLADAKLFQRATREMAQPFLAAGITHVVAIESRGFLLGGPIAQALDAGLIPVRKPGKLPGKTASVEYALEYGTDRLEIHDDACDGSMTVLIVDDVLATGGTAAATAKLVAGRGAEVAGFSFLMGLSFLKGRERLKTAAISELITY